MTADFIGVGWAFPVRADGHHVARAGDHDSVSESIWLILRTSPGERVMRPDFGCALEDFVFAAASAQTAAAIVAEVTRALTVCEPRIDLLRVRVHPDERAAATLLIEIDYRVRATNASFNLVYPFYLLERAPA